MDIIIPGVYGRKHLSVKWTDLFQGYMAGKTYLSSEQNYSRRKRRARPIRQAGRIIPGVYSRQDLSVKWAELFQGYIVHGRLDLLFQGYTAARIILPIVLMQNSSRGKEWRQFCPPGSSDDLCLLCINPSSMSESDC